MIKHCIYGLLGLCFFSVSRAQQPAFTDYEVTIPNSSVIFKMLPIKGGEFLYGSPDTEKDRKKDEGPRQMITISPFWMGEHEVTYDEFLLFFNDETTSRNSEVDAVTRPTPQYIDLSWGMGKQGGFPVNSMSQQTALMYCRWLYKQTGQFYRLPTEAEWEYACRAGTGSTYFFGDDKNVLKDYAWFLENSKEKYHKIKQKKPNPWGLYDMLGNVAEWTLDQYNDDLHNNLKEGDIDPFFPSKKKYNRVVRGGSFLDAPELLRCASRWKSESSWNRRDPQIPKSRWWLTDAMGVGFRIVRPLKQPATEEIEAFYDGYLKEEQ